MENIFNEIRAERERQDLKFGADRDQHPLEWNAILGEEFGEVSKEVVEVHFSEKTTEDLRKELVQVASVCVAWIQNLDK